MIASALGRDAVIVACAVSAGIHAALIPVHLEERTAAGLGFIGAAVLLTGLVVALTQRPNPPALAGAAAVLAGLIGSYALAGSSGLPLLHPDPESIDALALFTKAVEAGGLLAAAHLLWCGRSALARPLPQPKER
jgi:hypothetical protein